MTPKELLTIYRDAYKKEALDPKDLLPPAQNPYAGAVLMNKLRQQGNPSTMPRPTNPPKAPAVNAGNPPAKPAGLWDAFNLRRKPLPAAPNPKFVQSPIATASGEASGAGPDTRTWEAPTQQRSLDPRGWSDRKNSRNVGMQELNSALKERVSPRVWDNYRNDGTSFNMSREAMVRRINMLQRQKELDERMRRAKLTAGN